MFSNLKGSSFASRVAIIGGFAFGYFLINFLVDYTRRKRRAIWSDISDSEDSVSTHASEKPIHGYINRRKPRGISPNKGQRKNNSPAKDTALEPASPATLSRPLTPITWEELHSYDGAPIAGGADAEPSESDKTLVDDLASLSTIVAAQVDVKTMSAYKITEVGMEQFRQAVNFWETALDKIEEQDDGDGKMDSALEDLQYQLSEMLERAYRIQESVESKMLRTYSTEVAINAAIEEMDREWEEKRRMRNQRSVHSHDDSSSDVESFVSALSNRGVGADSVVSHVHHAPILLHADLSDLGEQKGSHPELPLFEAALGQLERSGIPCYSVRTKLLHCVSDTEFLAKLHCVRQAFQEVFKDESMRNYFVDCGRQIIADLLKKADKDPDEFQSSYDKLIDFVLNKKNLPTIEAELKTRGVKVVTFYDVVFDFLIFDSFDDLANPPSSVISVVQNRWLSNGFKETALSTAVWSVLKAKKRMLKYPHGFISHFYELSEHTSPVLAWGFLGPDTELKSICHKFKDEIMYFIRAVFDFKCVRYTTLAALTDDVTRLAKERLAKTMNVLSSGV